MDVLDKIRTPDWNRVFQDWPYERFVQHGENLCVSNANRAFNYTKCFVRFINSHAHVNAPQRSAPARAGTGSALSGVQRTNH